MNPPCFPTPIALQSPRHRGFPLLHPGSAPSPSAVEQSRVQACAIGARNPHSGPTGPDRKRLQGGRPARAPGRRAQSLVLCPQNPRGRPANPLEPTTHDPYDEDRNRANIEAPDGEVSTAVYDAPDRPLSARAGIFGGDASGRAGRTCQVIACNSGARSSACMATRRAHQPVGQDVKPPEPSASQGSSVVSRDLKTWETWKEQKR